MSYVGQPVKRFEDPKLLTGHGAFVGDVTLPDMLHAAVLRSPYAHARITAVDVSAARDLPGVVAVLTGADIAGILIPAVSVELTGVVTNKTPTGAYLGTGSPEAAFAMERTMDLIAHDLGLDPAEVRRRNFIPPDAFPYRSATGLTYDSGQYAPALERTLELLDYAGWREKARQRKPEEPLLGIGLATFTKSSGDHRIEHARVIIEPSGRIDVYTGISPHGQGNATSFAQLAADALGVRPSQVRVYHGDTAIVPVEEGTSASRGLIVGGSALYTVLQQARQTPAHVAAPLLTCPAAEGIVPKFHWSSIIDADF